MTGSLDTNVVLRLLVGDVRDQYISARALVDSGQFRVADAAAIEVTFALGRYYKFTRTEQRTVLVGFLALPNIESNLALLADSFDRYVSHPRLSFEDCYLVTAAEHSDSAPLFTFDEKLASQTSAELVR